MLTGHEEDTKSNYMNYFKLFLELENYELKKLDLLSAQNVPDDCKCLVVTSPKKDFSETETNAIKGYIEKGGSIIWLNDPYSASEETPNIKSILDMYGVVVRQDGFVAEQDKERYVLGSPDLILANTQYSPITENLKSVLLPDTGKLEFVGDLEALGVTKTDILTSSEKSFFRTNMQELSIKPVEGEEVGSFVLGAILEKSIGENTSKLVVFANNTFATEIAIDSRAAIGLYDNKDIIVNSVQYLAEIEDALTIRKSLTSTTYTATEAQDRIIKTIIFGLPIIIIIMRNCSLAIKKKKKIINNKKTHIFI